MAISFQKYIDITSGVGAGANVRGRELIGRLFTTNPLIPTDSFIEFDDLASVGTYFGTTSEEYLRANFYFSWISKNTTTPQSISFARWVNADTAPMIFGAKVTETLTNLQAITNGSFTLTLGGFTFNVGSLNFSAAGSLSAVAALIQTAIQAETGGGTQWTGATVTYSNTSGGFNLVGGSAAVADVSVAAGTAGTDISTIMGWLPQSINGSTGAIWSNGQLTETITNVLTSSAAASTNFGSFLFMNNCDLDLSQITEAATWNNAQNILYQFMVRVPVGSETSYNAALIGLGGTAMTRASLTTEYDEMCPMIILAATDYTKRNSVQNYMFQQFNLTPKVTTDADSNLLDSLLINYYGQTQTAGQFIAFYQRGVLTGPATSPSDQNVYANEQWLKDAAGVAIMSLFLSLPEISANTQGRAQLIAILQSVITQALFNGTISVGKTLNSIQQAFIAKITGDQNAWFQVQGIGYWLDCAIQSVVADGGNTEYQAVYTLVYSKDDIIRKVEGTHVLI
jgi:hypothetical protein